MSAVYLPLAGLRVIEFCWVWAGPMMGQHLADLGAEVVKVESVSYTHLTLPTILLV